MCHARSPTRRFEQLLEIYLSRKRRVYCPWPRHDSMSTTMIPLHAHNHGQRITSSCLPMDTTIYYSQDIQEHTCGMFSSLPGSRNFFPIRCLPEFKGWSPQPRSPSARPLTFLKGCVSTVLTHSTLYTQKRSLLSHDESTWRKHLTLLLWRDTHHFTLHTTP